MEKACAASAIRACDPAFLGQPLQRLTHVIGLHVALGSEPLDAGECLIADPGVVPKPQVDEQRTAPAAL
jgi:hypothetical protein